MFRGKHTRVETGGMYSRYVCFPRNIHTSRFDVSMFPTKHTYIRHIPPNYRYVCMFFPKGTFAAERRPFWPELRRLPVLQLEEIDGVGIVLTTFFFRLFSCTSLGMRSDGKLAGAVALVLIFLLAGGKSLSGVVGSCVGNQIGWVSWPVVAGWWLPAEGGS